MGEAGLELVIADLLVAGMALRTGAAAPDEGHRHPVADTPEGHVPAHRLDHPGQFVAWHMGQLDVAVMADPAVPVAAADASGHDLEYDAWGSGVGSATVVRRGGAEKAS